MPKKNTVITHVFKMRADIIGNQVGLTSKVIRLIAMLVRMWSNYIPMP